MNKKPIKMPKEEKISFLNQIFNINKIVKCY